MKQINSNYNGKLYIWINKNGLRYSDNTYSYWLMMIRTSGGINKGSMAQTVDELLQQIDYYLICEKHNDDYGQRKPELQDKIHRIQSILDKYKDQ